MDNEKLQINFAPGQTTAQVIIREGEATKQLDPKAPVKTEIVGTIGTIREYLKKRVARVSSCNPNVLSPLTAKASK